MKAEKVKKSSQIVADMEDFLSSLKVERLASPHTIRNYRMDLLSFYASLPEGIEIAQINAIHVRTFLAHLHSINSRRTIARKLASLRSFFRWMLKRKKIDKDFVRQLPSPKQEKSLPKFLTIEEVQVLLEAPDTTKKEGVRDKAILEVLYSSGIRVGELAQVRLEDLELNAEGGILKIRRKRK